MSLPPIQDILDEYELLEGEDRYRLLIDLGRKLEAMPDALKVGKANGEGHDSHAGGDHGAHAAEPHGAAKTQEEHH